MPEGAVLSHHLQQKGDGDVDPPPLLSPSVGSRDGPQEMAMPLGLMESVITLRAGYHTKMPSLQWDPCRSGKALKPLGASPRHPLQSLW